MSDASTLGYFFAFLFGSVISAFIFRFVFDVSTMHKRVKRIYRLMEQMAKEQGVPVETIERIRKKGE